jgi:hypothetical protein
MPLPTVPIHLLPCGSIVMHSTKLCASPLLDIVYVAHLEPSNTLMPWAAVPIHLSPFLSIAISVMQLLTSPLLDSL